MKNIAIIQKSFTSLNMHDYKFLNKKQLQKMENSQNTQPVSIHNIGYTLHRYNTFVIKNI